MNANVTQSAALNTSHPLHNHSPSPAVTPFADGMVYYKALFNVHAIAAAVAIIVVVLLLVFLALKYYKVRPRLLMPVDGAARGETRSSQGRRTLDGTGTPDSNLPFEDTGFYGFSKSELLDLGGVRQFYSDTGVEGSKDEGRGKREEIGECSVCLGEYKDKEKLKRLHACGHEFHEDCIDTWLLSSASCPICRVSLRPPTSNDSQTLRSDAAETQTRSHLGRGQNQPPVSQMTQSILHRLFSLSSWSAPVRPEGTGRTSSTSTPPVLPVVTEAPQGLPPTPQTHLQDLEAGARNVAVLGEHQLEQGLTPATAQDLRTSRMEEASCRENAYDDLEAREAAARQTDHRHEVIML